MVAAFRSRAGPGSEPRSPCGCRWSPPEPRCRPQRPRQTKPKGPCNVREAMARAGSPRAERMEAGRGIRHAAGSLLRRYPLDAAAAALAAALALGIVVNALALQ